MKILFIGDIVGKIGRQAVGRILPELKNEKKIDFVIANAENATHGTGMSDSTLDELLAAGVDFFTSGDHAYKRAKQHDVFTKYPVIAPANYSRKPLSSGFQIVKTKGGENILIINLIGQVFMKKPYENPFYKLDEILANISLQEKGFSAIIIDMHAEATSEKVCMGHYADGRVSAVLGTHTHVMTADAEVTEKGMAYITDVGMCGFKNGSLGIAKEGLLKEFLDNIKTEHVIPENGEALFCSVLVDVDSASGKAQNIEAIKRVVKIGS